MYLSLEISIENLLVSEGRLEVPPDPGDGDIPSNDCIFDEREAIPT